MLEGAFVDSHARFEFRHTCRPGHANEDTVRYVGPAESITWCRPSLREAIAMVLVPPPPLPAFTLRFGQWTAPADERRPA